MVLIFKLPSNGLEFRWCLWFCSATAVTVKSERKLEVFPEDRSSYSWFNKNSTHFEHSFALSVVESHFSNEELFFCQPFDSKTWRYVSCQLSNGLLLKQHSTSVMHRCHLPLRVWCNGKPTVSCYLKNLKDVN